MLQQAFIGLGANLGEPESTLKEAVLRIASDSGAFALFKSLLFIKRSLLIRAVPITPMQSLR